MRIFFDPSGQAGEPRQPNQDPWYIVAAVIIPDVETEIKMYNTHKEFLRCLRPNAKEFHSSEDYASSLLLLDRVNSLGNWSWIATAAYKPEFINTSLAKAENCQSWFIWKTLSKQKTALKFGQIIIDKFGGDSNHEALISYLQSDETLGQYTSVRNAVCSNSEQSYGLQLVDAIAAVLYKYKNNITKTNYENYLKIHHRQIAFWEYPRDASRLHPEGLLPRSQRKRSTPAIPIQEKLF
jgi:hypothetical protein